MLLEQRYPLLKIDQYVIMPNHIHAILLLQETAGVNPRPTIMDIVCAYKSLTTRQCKKVQPIDKLFQTSFYEHVIRDREDYNEIAEYIVNNPKQWELCGSKLLPYDKRTWQADQNDLPVNLYFLSAKDITLLCDCFVFYIAAVFMLSGIRRSLQ